MLFVKIIKLAKKDKKDIDEFFLFFSLPSVFLGFSRLLFYVENDFDLWMFVTSMEEHFLSRRCQSYKTQNTVKLQEK